MTKFLNSDLLLACALCLVSVSLLGCGPMQAATAISDGTVVLDQAEESGAQKYARYHFTKAKLLLAEAKKRNGYGEYEVARQWANEAKDLASEANRTARARQELDRRRIRVRPKTQPKPVTPKTVTPKADPAKPGTTKPPEKRKPLLPPPTRTKILPPSMGGGQ